MNSVEIDDKNVINLFDSLNEDACKEILMTALRKAGKELA